MPSTPSEMEEIRAFYDGGVEETRLQRGLGQVEYARTLEILQDCLPPPPAVVYDVGGGAGAYTF